MTRGHRLQDIVDAGLAPSVRWLTGQIKTGRVPGRLIGRHWVMTDEDIAAALEIWSPTPAPKPAPREEREEQSVGQLLSLTSTSQRRMQRAS